MSTVFLDTVGLLALWDEADQWHVAAERAFQEIVGHRHRVVTSHFVLLECGNASARKSYRQKVIQLQLLLEARNELVYPTEEDCRNGWIAYAKGESTQAGIVDLISFEIMRRLQITKALTCDRHFQAAGFELLM